MNPHDIMGGPLEPPTGGIAAFLAKTYEMVCDESCQHLIQWAADGDSFLVLDADKLSREVFPRFFKHRKFSSFIRQLNMYGFHKCGNPKHWEFMHENFKRDRYDLLPTIKRRAGHTLIGKASGTPTPSKVRQRLVTRRPTAAPARPRRLSAAVPRLSRGSSPRRVPGTSRATTPGYSDADSASDAEEMEEQAVSRDFSRSVSPLPAIGKNLEQLARERDHLASQLARVNSSQKSMESYVQSMRMQVDNLNAELHEARESHDRLSSTMRAVASTVASGPTPDMRVLAALEASVEPLAKRSPVILKDVELGTVDPKYLDYAPQPHYNSATTGSATSSMNGMRSSIGVNLAAAGLARPLSRSTDAHRVPVFTSKPDASHPVQGIQGPTQGVRMFSAAGKPSLTLPLKRSRAQMLEDIASDDYVPSLSPTNQRGDDEWTTNVFEDF